MVNIATLVFAIVSCGNASLLEQRFDNINRLPFQPEWVVCQLLARESILSSRMSDIVCRSNGDADSEFLGRESDGAGHALVGQFVVFLEELNGLRNNIAEVIWPMVFRMTRVFKFRSSRNENGRCVVGIVPVKADFV